MINVMLVGNPNTGKTTLFNSLTGANEKTGNWHGVTVTEKARVYQFKEEQIRLIDLPGIYSLSSLSFEEKVARDYIYKNLQDIVINICDASNLRRNLYLTLSLLELGLKVILVVNQIDKKPMQKCDYLKLSNLLGVKIIHLNAGDRNACQEINRAIVNFQEEREYALHYVRKIDLQKVSRFDFGEKNSRYYKIKTLEDDEYVKEKFKINEMFNFCDEIAKIRYDYIDDVLKDSIVSNGKVQGKSKLDGLFLNKILAFPVFLGILASVFYITFFSVGRWLSDLLALTIEKLIFSPLSCGLISLFGQGSWITNLFCDGVFGGAGAILAFLPQVGLLFLFLSILEDSGYLARIAFLFDDILSKVGLSGKAIYTLLMGFGCSTSAVLTSRNMEDEKSKMKTALLTPYMSCSAKFPIYTVLGGAFFGANNIWVVLGLYLLGVIIALLISFIFEKTYLKSQKQSFILEFPSYRMTSIKSAVKVLWKNIKLFISRVGGIIIAMNVIVWLLSNFTISFKYVPNGKGQSMLETFGRLLAPMFIPLGFGSWALVASLIAGLVAKEVIVSSIAMFNNVPPGEIASSILSLSAVASFASASSVLSFLVFCLLYMPCFATISVLNKEIGRKWTAISVLIEFVVAYICAFVVYSISSACEIFGVTRVVLLLLAMFTIIISVVVIFKKLKKRRCPYGKNCLKECNKK
ncbi:MAG: ferrous iron transport protein B [Clostridiales bacterium]|nr:ferrous iron transport protein B [Clostridiales bacterium]